MAPYTTPDIPLEPSPGSSQMSLHAPYPPYASSSRVQSFSTSSSSDPLRPHQEEEEEHDTFDPFSLDPQLRLRTVRTAHSVIAESIRSERDADARKRKRRIFSGLRRRGTMSTLGTVKDSLRKKGSDSEGLSRPASSEHLTEHGTPKKRRSVAVSDSTPPAPDAKGKGKAKVAARRTLYVNVPLPTQLLTTKGDPIIRYVRNKVRTSKYTIVSFIPKNLFEQFRRAANIYFLALVIIQLFSIFGAPNAQIGMLPLIAILGMTAIKDGIEDWRRARLDNEVNNSAATKLGGWRNVNQPEDPRSFLEKLFGLNAPHKPSKGVRKLRDMEAKAGHQIVMERQKEIDEEEELDSAIIADGQIHSLDSVSREPSLPGNASAGLQSEILRKIPSAPSIASRKSSGVMDWSSPSRGTAHWERTLWKKLEVGDLVLLRDNEQIPADIVVLSTSNADSLAFVETKNLDGETNLKVRRALKATSSMNSEEDLEHASFVVDSEAPHANLYTYNGVLRYFPANDGKEREERQEAITINELLLRGCTLRNTKWVIGLVVFTGADTKIMLNGGDTPSKRSKIEKETNFNVIMNFVILMILCVVTAVLHGYYRSLSGTSANYYEAGSWASENIYIDSLIIFVSCLIVFQNIVPISLYITIEIVKTIQAFFIFQDIEMYYAPYDTPCVPKTWNISDDLGQIEYVFSDKTGTLTQNIMEFKKCSIQGIAFGEGITEAMMGAAKRDGRELAMDQADQGEEIAVLKERMVTEMTRSFNNRYFREDQLTLIAPELSRHLANPDDALRPYIIEFFRALAICHTVLSDTPEPKKPFVIDYKAESPDEAALVGAARDVGFPFVNRNNTRIDIEVLGTPERWTPLRVLEFNSTRKRMSVVARDPSGRIVLFCKGADSVIYERLKEDHDPELKAATLKDLETFANGGLRTLCIASRYLEEDEFNTWAKVYDAAAAAVEDREHEIEKASELIEHSLTILGATALEDKLQEGVPEAIAMLHQAGIKLWILTGDKLQTAIEIGYSCNLLTNDMEVMIISADSETGARAQIEAGLNKIASILGPPAVGRHHVAGSQETTPQATFAVVIDGESLRYALQPGLKALFLSLGMQCAAVICCRVSPSQKALTVKLVKDGCNAMTLSIGDGANDVAMIQEANVGVGLFGLEGSQAAMSADYAFGQFRFLTRLLLVHGRWSYVRIADMHANFFYKNIIWTMSMFWFLIYNSFDATYLFEYTFILLYNLVFTSLPVGILGAFDQDTNAAASMAFPALYKRGIQGLEYTRRRFWFYMTDGLYQSVIIFFIPYLAYAGGTTWSHDGLDTNSLWDFGTTVACAGVVSANMYVGINMRYWTFITWIVLVGSPLLCFIWIPIYSALASPPFQGVVGVIYPTFSFWTIVILTVFMAIGPRWIASAFRQSYMPRDKDIIREAWIAGHLKDDLGIQHRNRRKRRLAQAKAQDEPQGFDSPPMSKDLEEDVDGRGVYVPANTMSPRRGSPVMSGQSTPRSLFSYPPASPAIDRVMDPLAPSPRGSNTLPPPHLLRNLSEGSATPRSGLRRGESATSGVATPPYEYHSPSALDKFNLTGHEIKRMSRASTELRRASLQVDPQVDYGRADPAGDRTMTPPSVWDERGTSSVGNRAARRPQGPLNGDEGLGPRDFSHSVGLNRVADQWGTTAAGTHRDEERQGAGRWEGEGGEGGDEKRKSYVDFSSPRRGAW